MLALIWTSLKSYYGLSAIAHYARKKDLKLLGSAGIMLAVVAAVAPLAYYYWRLLAEVYVSGLMFEQPQLVITSGILTSCLLVFFLGAAYVLSVFYFSTDLQFLVPLPFHPYQILGAKTVVVWVSELIIIAPFFWLANILYGVREGASISFYLISALIYLTLPLIPIALVTMIIMIIMNLSNLSRYKDAMRLAGMFLMVLVIVVVMGLFSRVPPGQEAELIQRIISEEEGLITQSTRIYPPALWATRALTGAHQAWNLGLFALTSLGLVAGTLIAAQRWFFAGLIGSSDTVARSTVKAGAYRRFLQVRHPAITIMQKEMKVLVRTPIYLFNSLGIVIIMPLLLIVPLALAGDLNIEVLRQLIAEQAALMQLVGVGFIAMMALVAPGSSSSFSREGRQMWLAKTIPVHPRVQVHGRLAQGYAATAWSLPLVAIIGLGLVGWTLPQLAVVMVMGLIVSLPLILANLLIDLVNPYLTWENPQQDIKQNLNVLFGMVIGGAILYGQGHFAHQIWQDGHPVWIIMTFLASTSLLLGGILYAVLHQIAEGFFHRIQV